MKITLEHDDITHIITVTLFEVNSQIPETFTATGFRKGNTIKLINHHYRTFLQAHVNSDFSKMQSIINNTIDINSTDLTFNTDVQTLLKYQF